MIGGLEAEWKRLRSGRGVESAPFGMNIKIESVVVSGN
jgi:hypothetical protein